MKKGTLQASLGLLIFGISTLAWGDPICAPASDPHVELISQIKEITEIASPSTPRKTFLENSDHFLHPGSPGLGNKAGHPAGAVRFPTFGKGNPVFDAFTACQASPNSAQYFQCAKTKCATMNLQDRLLYNSYVGVRVSNGYDASELTAGKSATIEDVFQRFKGSTSTGGGVCREEHAFIGLNAQACGFDDSGLLTITWEKNSTHGNDAGLHTTAVYRDKGTGDYYLQNYYDVFKLDAKNFTEARTMSQLFLSPFSTADSVESITGKIHSVPTALGEWMHNQVSALFDLKKKNGLAVTSGTAEQSLAYRSGNFGLVVSSSNGYKFVTGQALLEAATHKDLNNGGSIDLNSRLAIGPSFTIVPSAQYYDDSGFSHVSNEAKSPSRLAVGIISESHLVYHPTAKSKAQIEVDSVSHDLSFRSAGDGGNDEGTFNEYRAGVSYHTSNLDHHGTDLYLGEIGNLVFKSNFDLTHRTLDLRTELDAVHWISPNAKLCGRVVAYHNLSSPDAIGYSLCGEIQGKLGYVGAQTSRISSNPSQDPFFDQSKAINEFYVGIRKTWENANTGQYTIQLSARSSNGQGLKSIDLDPTAVPGGRRSGTSIDLNITNKR